MILARHLALAHYRRQLGLAHYGRQLQAALDTTSRKDHCESTQPGRTVR